MMKQMILAGLSIECGFCPGGFFRGRGGGCPFTGGRKRDLGKGTLTESTQSEMQGSLVARRLRVGKLDASSSDLF